ncbi:MAG: hypothetical protein H6667_18780 [Ardenticatenaceae bacterium]|nr:hypothetical protein [Ardenticatenaceae bacterium]
MDFGSLLKRSWNIVWNNKFLFVLGFLAALGSGGTNGNGGGRGNFNYNFGPNDVPAEILDQLQRFWTQYGALVIGLVCLGIIVSIILWLVRLVAQAGLISSVARIEAGEKVTFSEAFAAGVGKLGRVIGVNVVMYGPFTLFGILAGIAGLATAGAAIGSAVNGASNADIEAMFGGIGIFWVCIGCIGCLIVPLVIFVTAIYPFAQRGAVLQDLGVIESIRHGWQVLKANTSDVILLIVLFIVLGIVFGLATVIVLLPFALVSLGPGLASLMMSGGSFDTGNILLLAGGGICIGLVGAAVNSIMVAFRSTAVTLAYQEFTNKKAVSE